MSNSNLLSDQDPPAVSVENPEGASPYLLTADHAGRRIPARLGSLGLNASELDTHVAWDIGIEGLSRRLARTLDARLILQTYSRLVIDCNRAPGVASSIATVSERTEIPGNRALSDAEVEARTSAIFRPYHDRIRAELDARLGRAAHTMLVAMHSFTPVYESVARPWHVGVLYSRDMRLGHVLLELLRADATLVTGDNQPYGVRDAIDYTLPVHGATRGLAHVGLEIRQDLIAHEAGQEQWAQRLAGVLTRALAYPVLAAT